MTHSRVHDRLMLDALESLEVIKHEGPAWRVTRTGRDPIRPSTADGRWSPTGEFEVLYTSFERDGALAEIGYRLSLEPVWPSKLTHEIHELSVEADQALNLADLSDLAALGVDIARYTSFDYAATQAIAAAANFLELDGLIVPSARFDCRNLVLLAENRDPALRLEVVRSDPVDWAAWRASSS